MKSNKQRRLEIFQKRTDKRDKQKLQKKLSNTNVAHKPRGALSVDTSKFSGYFSAYGWFGLPWIARDGFYQDYEFNCKDCGIHQTWTASQQKIYYEIWGGNIEKIAVRCRACRLTQKTHRLETERLRLAGLANKKNQK